jgi:hypothetical protein
MPQCTVYVYDDTLSAVSSKFIEIRECDSFGKKIDIQTAAILGPGEFGANITLPNPPEPIVIWVDDTSSHFAPTSLAHFNSKQTARLDVTLYALPGGSGGGGGGPTAGAVRKKKVQILDAIARPIYQEEVETVNGTARLVNLHEGQTVEAIARHIHRQVQTGKWTDSEALGVKSLVDTATRAINTPKLDSELKVALSRWREQLQHLSISIMAERQQTLSASKVRTREA